MEIAFQVTTNIYHKKITIVVLKIQTLQKCYKVRTTVTLASTNSGILDSLKKKERKIIGSKYKYKEMHLI